MKVLLVNPPSTGVFTTFGVSLPPMGLLYIAACLEQAGHTVEVRDLQCEPDGLSPHDVKAADIVGITSDTTRIEKAMQIARQAAALGRTVVMGGPHPQFMADEILRTGHVRYIVKGEGELTFPLLLEAIDRGGDPAAVAGIIFRDGKDLVETPNGEPPDVELLPFPARHLLDLNRYSAVVDGVLLTPVVTSRGCPGGCSFCSSSSFFGRGWRSRTPESVLAELDEFWGGLLEEMNRAETLLLMTSDHGNIEDWTVKGHTLNRVPTILIGATREQAAERIHSLVDITPTVMHVLLNREG